MAPSENNRIKEEEGQARSSKKFKTEKKIKDESGSEYENVKEESESSEDEPQADPNIFELGSGMKKVTVKLFNGKPLIDIRAFFKKDGKELPTKKGISLTMDQWTKLKKLTSKIDKAVKDIK